MLVNENIEIKHENDTTKIYLENNENVRYTFVNSDDEFNISKSILYILTSNNKINFIQGSDIISIKIISKDNI
ncbi:hypothetical protein [Desulfurella sp.]|uniref:hypothetical protein n=1 Tax=Desulfurella sp. TaxID=1962857 RepID=UPI0025C2D4FF|nr:hypothetical protein [Desulfurella sp.]